MLVKLGRKDEARARFEAALKDFDKALSLKGDPEYALNRGAVLLQALRATVALMASGKLHRYGEVGAKPSEVSSLEAEFAAEIGTRYCVAMNSCGGAMFVALKAAGVKPGDAVLVDEPGWAVEWARLAKAAGARYVTSVCTGSLVLGAAANGGPGPLVQHFASMAGQLR